MGREQKVVWVGFTVVAIGVSVILWLVMSLMAGMMLPLGGLMFQMIATAMIYPLFGIVFGHLHRRVLVEV